MGCRHPPVQSPRLILINSNTIRNNQINYRFSNKISYTSLLNELHTMIGSEGAHVAMGVPPGGQLCWAVDILLLNRPVYLSKTL